MRARWLVVVVLATSCKDKQPAAPAPQPAQQPPGSAAPVAPAPSPPSGSAAPMAHPSVPTRQPLGEALSIEDAAKVIPTLDGKEILPLKQTSDKRQVHATWCLDGDAADDVARRVGRQMADAKYTDLTIRGDARKAGVQGDRDGFRMSMIVSGSTASNCPAPKHYFASATIFRIP